MERVEHLTQAYSQAPWRSQLQILGLILAGVIVAAVVAGIYLSVTARSAFIGREIQDMDYQIGVLRESNADLQAKLAMLNAAGRMEERARALGFAKTPAEETEYMAIPGYVERQPVSLAPATIPHLAGAPALPDEYTESLFTWALRAWTQSPRWLPGVLP